MLHYRVFGAVVRKCVGSGQHGLVRIRRWLSRLLSGNGSSRVDLRVASHLVGDE
jgi:hypothetical protein